MWESKEWQWHRLPKMWRTCDCADFWGAEELFGPVGNLASLRNHRWLFYLAGAAQSISKGFTSFELSINFWKMPGLACIQRRIAFLLQVGFAYAFEDVGLTRFAKRKIQLCILALIVYISRNSPKTLSQWKVKVILLAFQKLKFLHGW